MNSTKFFFIVLLIILISGIVYSVNSNPVYKLQHFQGYLDENFRYAKLVRVASNNATVNATIQINLGNLTQYMVNYTNMNQSVYSIKNTSFRVFEINGLGQCVDQDVSTIRCDPVSWGIV